MESLNIRKQVKRFIFLIKLIYERLVCVPSQFCQVAQMNPFISILKHYGLNRLMHLKNGFDT